MNLAFDILIVYQFHTKMQLMAGNVEEYLSLIPEEWRNDFLKLRETILENLPGGFEECIQYNMISYVVPLALYPKGYHSKPGTPLPFISLGLQKNYIALHHIGLYANQTLNSWFEKEYPNHSKSKLNKGKGCIRFGKTSDIPYKLIGELLRKISVNKWIEIYESLKPAKK
ncbi:MAG: DUF1801 domain-containing protein [Bacteroidales bacterium]